MQVNEKGEILDSNNFPLEGSNITDLIQHAVRDRRRNIQPPAWSYFKDRLKGMNVPQSLLNYETLDEMKQPLRIQSEVSTQGKGTSRTAKRQRSVSPKVEVSGKTVAQTTKRRNIIKPKRFRDENFIY